MSCPTHDTFAYETTPNFFSPRAHPPPDASTVQAVAQARAAQCVRARIRGDRWEKTRRAVFDRDKWRCKICGGVCRKGIDKPHCDHIEAVNGPDDPRFFDMTNLQTLHHRCHSAKTVTVDGGFGNPKHRGEGSRVVPASRAADVYVA
jgi:hypothetical protein